MRQLSILFFILLTVYNISFASSANLNDRCTQKTDKEYQELILGTWNNEEEMRFSDDIVYKGKQTFFKNGDLIIIFFDKAYPKQILTTIKATWKIKNGKLYEHALSSSSQEFNMGNKTTVDQIICMNQRMQQLRDEDGTLLKRFKK